MAAGASRRTRRPGNAQRSRLGTEGRTTISLGQELGQRLAAVATAEGLSAMEAVRRAVSDYVEFREAASVARDGMAAGALRILQASRKLDNPFQQLVAHWRLARTDRLFEEIAAFRGDLDAWPAEVYLFRVLTELLQPLGANDELLIVSNLGFWSSSASSGDSSIGRAFSGVYLAAQEEAVSRGLVLHRVFLLAEHERSSDELTQHREFLTRVQRQYPNQVRVEMRVFDNLAEARMRLGHFAVIRRGYDKATKIDEGCMVVEPVYYGSSENIHLRLRFSRGSGEKDQDTRFYLDRFSQAALGAVSVLTTDEVPEQRGR